MGTAVLEIRFRGCSQALLYNTIRPHASIGYKPPAPEVFVPAFAAWPAALRRPVPPAALAQRANLKLTFHPDHSAGADRHSLTITVVSYWLAQPRRASHSFSINHCIAV